MSRLAERAKMLKPSATLAMANRARELAAQGKDVVSLTVGEPNWPSFKVACEAGKKAIDDGFTKYTPAHGIPELRAAIAKEASLETGVTYQANDVVVGSGAKYIIYAALMMILDPGDEVLIPSPYWVSYPTMVELASGVAKTITCDQDVNFKLTAQALRKAITPKTKALILCSPSNPTGLMYSKEELKALSGVLKENPKIMVISDDIYNQLVFTGEKVAPHLLHVAPELKDQVLVVNGASKTYSMTGWRVGWALGVSDIMKPFADFLSQTTSNLSSISQKAVLAALLHGHDELVVAQKNLQERMRSAVSLFSKIPGAKVIPPDGAFYIWLDVKSWFNAKTPHSVSVAEQLLNEHLVATVPGSEFGCEGFLRLSFATSEENLVKASQRMTSFAESIAGGRSRA
jgi:aspartate aminotransferase